MLIISLFYDRVVRRHPTFKQQIRKVACPASNTAGAWRIVSGTKSKTENLQIQIAGCDNITSSVNGSYSFIPSVDIFQRFVAYSHGTTGIPEFTVVDVCSDIDNI
jgi:hypothetical protein